MAERKDANHFPKASDQSTIECFVCNIHRDTIILGSSRADPFVLCARTHAKAGGWRSINSNGPLSVMVLWHLLKLLDKRESQVHGEAIAGRAMTALCSSAAIDDAVSRVDSAIPERYHQLEATHTSRQ